MGHFDHAFTNEAPTLPNTEALTGKRFGEEGRYIFIQKWELYQQRSVLGADAKSSVTSAYYSDQPERRRRIVVR